jgi:hypothetical protein
MSGELNVKIGLSFDIREDVDFEQRKVGVLHRLSRMKAESSTSTSKTKGGHCTSIVKN